MGYAHFRSEHPGRQLPKQLLDWGSHTARRLPHCLGRLPVHYHSGLLFVAGPSPPPPWQKLPLRIIDYRGNYLSSYLGWDFNPLDVRAAMRTNAAIPGRPIVVITRLLFTKRPGWPRSQAPLLFR